MMSTLSHTTDTPDVQYGVSLIATPAATSLSPAETARVAHWLREAQAAGNDAGAGVPTHCSNIIIQLCGLVQRLSGEPIA